MKIIVITKVDDTEVRTSQLLEDLETRHLGKGLCLDGILMCLGGILISTGFMVVH
jgi:hypothetical protein